MQGRTTRSDEWVKWTITCGRLSTPRAKATMSPFASWYDVTQPLIWRLCNVLGSPGEEDDLVQDTYLRAFRSLPSYRGEAPITAWLLSIARRVCADHVRRTGARAPADGRAWRKPVRMRG